MASIVMTGRLCCLRWVTGDDCVRPWCGPFAAATPTGADEAEKKLRLAPAGRPTVCERPCVGLRGRGAAVERSPSEGPIADSLDLAAAAGALTDAVELPILASPDAGSAVPCVSGGAGAAAAAALLVGAWIESAKLRPGWLDNGAESSEVGAGMWGGVSLEGTAFKAGACSGREGSGACELVRGEAGSGPDDGSGNPGELASGLSTSTGNNASATRAPSSSLKPFTRRTGARFAILGDREPEPTEGEGLVLSKFWGSCFNESSRMGDISCNCAFSMLAVVPGSGLVDAIVLDGTPQSSRSGRLSSSSAQSMWLLGVEGL